MKELLLVGLWFAFILAAEAIPPYIPYEDTLEVSREVKFRASTKTIRRVDSMSKCLLFCLKDKNCISLAYHDTDNTCKFIQQNTNKKLQTFELDVAVDSKVVFLPDRISTKFDVRDVAAHRGYAFRKSLTFNYKPDCYRVCEQDPLCIAVFADYASHLCDKYQPPDCQPTFYHCYAYYQYRVVQYEHDTQTLFLPRLKPKDSLVLVGLKPNVDMCDSEQKYPDTTHRGCEQKCLDVVGSLKCAFWGMDGSVGECTLCNSNNPIAPTFTANQNAITGFPQSGFALPELKGVKILAENRPIKISTMACKNYCDTREGARCKYWSYVTNICSVAGGPYVKAKLTAGAQTGFVKRDAKRDEPCVFKGVQFIRTITLKWSPNHGTTADCWEFCQGDLRCTKATYKADYHKTNCTADEYYKDLDFSDGDYVSIALRSRDDGSCRLKGAKFNGTHLKPIRKGIQSHGDCQKECEKRSAATGDCYSWTWYSSSKQCYLYGLNHHVVKKAASGDWSGQIQF